MLFKVPWVGEVFHGHSWLVMEMLEEIQGWDKPNCTVAGTLGPRWVARQDGQLCVVKRGHEVSHVIGRLHAVDRQKPSPVGSILLLPFFKRV